MGSQRTKKPPASPGAWGLRDLGDLELVLLVVAVCALDYDVNAHDATLVRCDGPSDAKNGDAAREPKSLNFFVSGQPRRHDIDALSLRHARLREYGLDAAPR